MNNKVELIGYYGSDEIIACSAWTSTSRNLTEEKKARVDKLINMLWRDGHHTPFEKGIVHFLVNTEIATHIQILKHRIASFNGESARYKELKEDKMYIPQDWKGIECSEDFGLSFPTYGEDWSYILQKHSQQGNNLYHQCVKDLEIKLGRKRAKESARFFKNYNMQYEGDFMINMRSFANFEKLRNSEHSQKEIRDVAAQMINLVKNIEGNPFKYTILAWEQNKIIPS